MLSKLGTILVLLEALFVTQVGAQDADAANVDAYKEEVVPDLNKSLDSTDASADELMIVPVNSQQKPNYQNESREGQSRSRLIEEIIVTAQKREENLQDVPISISAFSSDVLDAKGVVDPKDLNTAVPAFQFGSTAGFTTVYLRGVGSDAFLFADPSVALYIDGIYFPFSHGSAQAFGSIERIEILKGPQGTLFGRNATGGAINVVAKAPDQELATTIETSFANNERSHTKIYTNIPLTDSLAVSVAGLYNTEMSYQNGEIDGENFPREVTGGGRLKIKWSPLDNLDVTLSGFRLHSTGANAAYQSNIAPSILGKAVGISAASPLEGSVDTAVFIKVDNTVVYQQTDLRLDPFDIKLLASHQYNVNKEAFDYDGSTKPLTSLSTDNLYAKVTTAELQVLSNQTSWGVDWFDWIAGAYFFKSTQGFDPLNLYLANVDLGAGEIAGISLPSQLVSLLRTSLTGQLPIPNGRVSLVPIVDTKSVAEFVQSTVHFTDWADLTLGLRYQNETRTVAESNVGLANTDGSRTPLIDYPHESANLKSYSPKVSLSMHPTDDVLGYVSWQRAVKSGAFNAVSIYEPPAYVKPEYLTAVEAGFKADFFDHLLRLNGAVFQSEIKNLQVQFVSLLNGGVVSFENAPQTRIRGAELDATIQVLPDYFDSLVVTASGAYLDGKYTDYPQGSGYDPNRLGLFSGTLDFTGNKTVRTPKYSGDVGVSKTFDTQHGPLEIGADLYFNSGFYYTAQNDPLSKQQGYEIFNAHVSYLYEPWSLRLTAFGQNINKADYTNGVLQDDFGTVAFEAPSVIYGLRMKWDF